MIIKYTKLRLIYFVFSGILIIASIVAISNYGLKPGIDFTGGSILEIEYAKDRPSSQEIRNKLADLDLGSYFLQLMDGKGIILRMKDIGEDIHNEILTRLGKNEGEIEEKRFESIGPTIGSELRGRTQLVVALSLLALLLYIAIAFHKIQRPLKSWKYGVSSLFALCHDILIPLGVFAFCGFEITIPIITALLTVLGYSINNTVVVFDRIRENLSKVGGSFNEIVDKSLNQTLSRQINTSLTVLLALSSIFFFGGETLKYFSLALILGVLIGMYSSFFIAGPLLVSWFNFSQKKQRK